MTKQEAIELLDIDYSLFPDDGEHYLIAIECIEKQIPKKPIEKESCFPNHLIVSCPECCHAFGVFILGDKMSKITTYRSAKFNAWCPNCGNKLDWSDNE